MITIHTKKTVAFAHYVDGDTKCANLHGHNWTFEVWVDGEVQYDGMVIDFSKIKNIINKLDHAFVVPEKNVQIVQDEIFILTSKGTISLPYDFKLATIKADFITAENLAVKIANEIYNEVSGNFYKITIRVYESSDSYASYTKLGNMRM